MKKYDINKENKVLEKKFNYYLILKQKCLQNNLDIVLYIDKTSYNAMFAVQSDFTKRIENLFVTLQGLLNSKDTENYCKTKKNLYKELDKFELFFNNNKKQLQYILDYLKNKNSNQKS